MRSSKLNHQKKTTPEKPDVPLEGEPPTIQKEDNQQMPQKRNIISFETPSRNYWDKNGTADNYGW
jgi:hypothetical protein